MRRKDREITDLSDILSILRKCEIGRIAFAANSIPYIVPMNFGFEENNGQVSFYFHCAKQGKKLDMLAENNNVCFEADCLPKLIEAETACNCSMEYESVIAFGKMKQIMDSAEKKSAMDCIMKHYSDRTDFTYRENALNAICILKFEVDSITGKRNQHK